MGPGGAHLWLELGHVSGVFGVRGEVRLYLHNPASHLLEGEHPVQLESPTGERREVRIRARPGAGKRILGSIRGVDTPEQAAALKGWRLLVEAEALPPLDEAEYYLWQMEGATVRLAGEPQDVGRVAAVHQSGPVDLLEIDVGGAEPIFVPSTTDFVEAFDRDAGVLVLRPEALES